MIPHNFHRPIPPDTVRVSVIHNGESFTIDLASAKIADAIQAFEDQCDGPMSADRCMAAAVEAADHGDARVVVSAALWLFLFQDIDGEINAERLAEMVATNGSALLTAMAYQTTGAWTFKLFAMLRWPAVAPYPVASRDRRRR